MKTITIIGNLGANAVCRKTSEGKDIMTFYVAVNAANDQAIWFGVVSNYREKVFPFLVKGQCVCVVGDLRPAMYNGQLDLTVNADRIELCGAKPSSEEQCNDMCRL